MVLSGLACCVCLVYEAYFWALFNLFFVFFNYASVRLVEYSSERRTELEELLRRKRDMGSRESEGDADPETKEPDEER